MILQGLIQLFYSFSQEHKVGNSHNQDYFWFIPLHAWSNWKLLRKLDSSLSTVSEGLLFF